jgi:hypothetical protein
MAVFEGTAFLNWLARHQVLSPETRRVIIDAEVGKPVRVYVEQFMDNAVLAFTPPTALREALIERVPVTPPTEQTGGEPQSDALAAVECAEPPPPVTPPGAHPGASGAEPTGSP